MRGIAAIVIEMSALGNTAVNSMPTSYARPPGWFRYGVVALATLILCSCQFAPLPKDLSQNRRGLAHFAESSEQNVPVPLSGTAIYEATDASPQVIRLTNHQVNADAPACPLPTGGPLLCADDSPIGGPPDEYLCDGGDFGLPAGVRADWRVDGLEQEDTIAHYDTVDGRTVVTPSNRVCIYAPRFGVVRRVIDLHEYARYDMAGGFEQSTSLAKINESEEAATSLARLEPSIHRTHQPPSLLRERQQPGELDRDQRAGEFDGSLAPYANLQVIRIGTVSNEEKALLARSSLAAITWAGDQSPQITLDKRRAQASVSDRGAGAVYHLKEPNKPRLRLIKLASSGSALPGEEIEFTLRFDNVGNRVIGNVTIVDNLTTRLEYVPESAKSSLAADFSTEPNEGGSVLLRWEIQEPVEAGQGGILQFKCKVR